MANISAIEARITDYSMMSIQEINDPRMEDNFGQDAFNDLTDLQNDEFIVRFVLYSVHFHLIFACSTYTSYH